MARLIPFISVGVGIKISADGPITAFKNREEVFSL
jgi:hypothetical protein